MNSDVSTLADWIAESPSTVFSGAPVSPLSRGSPIFAGRTASTSRSARFPLRRS